jgi:hypothetical protein
MPDVQGGSQGEWVVLTYRGVGFLSGTESAGVKESVTDARVMDAFVHLSPRNMQVVFEEYTS